MSAEASADAGSFRCTLVYLVRHGQTPLNESGVLRGLADPPLDETGRRQAARLGAALGSRGLAAVFSSPLLRARQTAQPVSERAGLEVAVDQCLLDRDYGPWTGISRESVTARWGSVDRAPGVSRARRSGTGPSGG
jgi:broad specificity phosphatase PhoE